MCSGLNHERVNRSFASLLFSPSSALSEHTYFSLYISPTVILDSSSINYLLLTNQTPQVNEQILFLFLLLFFFLSSPPSSTHCIEASPPSNPQQLDLPACLAIWFSSAVLCAMATGKRRRRRRGRKRILYYFYPLLLPYPTKAVADNLFSSSTSSIHFAEKGGNVSPFSLAPTSHINELPDVGVDSRRKRNHRQENC